MLNRIVTACLLLFALAACDGCDKAHATDATSTWDSYAATYNFQTSTQAAPGCTFAQAYLGSDFGRDLPAIEAAVSSVCGTPIMPIDGDELLHARLANW